MSDKNDFQSEAKRVGLIESHKYAEIQKMTPGMILRLLPDETLVEIAATGRDDLESLRHYMLKSNGQN